VPVARQPDRPVHAAQQRSRTYTEADLEEAEQDSSVGRLRTSRKYMEPHINPPEFLKAQREKKAAELEKMKGFPEAPVRDVLGFLLEHANLPSRGSAPCCRSSAMKRTTSRRKARRRS
jgi:spore cortex formation protein SpoVR/YcgB (stage V sporulation)